MPKRVWMLNKRQEVALTQKAISETIGISVQHYGYIENGTKGGNITLGVAARIAVALGMKLDEFFALEEDFQCKIKSDDMPEVNPSFKCL